MRNEHGHGLNTGKQLLHKPTLTIIVLVTAVIIATVIAYDDIP